MTEQKTVGLGDLAQAMGGQEKKSAYVIGKWYSFRTVTMTNAGRLIAIHPHELVLDQAAWIVDTGRYSDYLKDVTKCVEMEPYTKPCIVERGAIVDGSEVEPFAVRW